MQVVSISIRPWTITLVAAVFLLLSLIVPVVWQISLSSHGTSLSYLSFAHYYPVLSPVFTSISVITAIMLMVVAIFTHVCARQWFSRSCTGDVKPSIRYLCLPIPLSAHIHRRLCTTSLSIALIGMGLFIVSVSIHVKLRSHFVVAAIAAVFLIVWTVAVNVLLFLHVPGSSSAMLDNLCMFTMSVLPFGIIPFSLCTVFFMSSRPILSVISEYVVMSLMDLYLFTLAFRLRREKLELRYTEAFSPHEDRGIVNHL